MAETLRLQDLIDLPRLQALLDSVYSFAGITSAIVGLDGEILTASGWQDLCTKFHRVHPEAAQDCTHSDVTIIGNIACGKGQTQSTCPRGLTDTATPLIIEGKHLANVFTGQHFLQPPDREWARQQARRFDFDEAAYLEAFDRVPIITQEQLNQHLAFIAQLTESFAFQGLVQLRTLRAKESLRASEERSSLILQNALDGCWIVDLNGRLLSVNEAYCTMSGYTTEELLEMTIAHLDAVEAPEDVAAYIQMIQAGRVNRFETLHRRKDGTMLPVELCVQVMPGGDQLFAFIRDISERKRAEEEKLALQAQLVQSQKLESLGTLAGGVAHDMNNVLGAILGLASANLLTQPPGSPALMAFEMIVKAAERGGQLVKGLLNFARKSPVEERLVDLNDLLHEEVHLLERTTLGKIRFETDLSPDLCPVLGDPNALVHAIMNLAVNAVDAMPDGGVLTLSTRNLNPDWIEVLVGDTGFGMTKAILEKAMDPFFTTKEVGKGTGLGLALVYSTIRAHHGKLELHSEPGQGTQVKILLPVCTQPPKAIPLPGAEPPAPHARALKVLVVDDDELIRCSTSIILEQLGHSLTAASSGEEALALLEAGAQPELVILDMNMPGLGGCCTLVRLRALRPTLPVLLATGRVDQAVLDLQVQVPMVTLLPKPFGLKDLQERLALLGPKALAMPGLQER